jgi:transposase
VASAEQTELISRIWYDGITLAFCWSHVRREFIELAKGKTAPIAEETLQRIAALYAIEAEIRGQPPGIRQAVRQAKSKPLVEALFVWLETQLARLPGGSPTAQAIRYALNHRDGLVRILGDGRIDLDTNTVERAIRPLCLSRKNALFASGDDGGARWAAVASLVETCKLNGVNPQRYFTDLLTRLVNGWPNSRIDELMPWCWADPKNPPPSIEDARVRRLRLPIHALCPIPGRSGIRQAARLLSSRSPPAAASGGARHGRMRA